MITPKPYQVKGIKRLIHWKRVLLADDTGLGKSCQSLHAAVKLATNQPIIVVCPNSVKWGWEIEARKHVKLPCWILSGRTPPSSLPLSVPPIVVLNWDILDAWTDYLLRLKPGALILDESHYMKTPNMKRTKAARKLGSAIKHVFALSGTPIENRPAEFFTVLNLLRPDLFPSFYRFGYRYCDPKRKFWGMEFKGASNLAELNEILYSNVMVRRTKEQVLSELPPVRRKIIPLEFDRTEYDFLRDDFQGWLRQHNKVASQQAEALCQLNRLLQVAALSKLPQVVSWVQDFLEATDRKLVLFGYHKKFLLSLLQEFNSLAVLVDGSTPAKTRQERINQFAECPKTRLFLGNILAAGTGVNRLTVSSDVAIAELVWVPSKLIQAIGRLHRIGQKNPVNVTYLLAKGTIETLLCRTLQHKQKIVDQSLDGREHNQDFVVFNQVLKELRSNHGQKTKAQT